MYGERVPIVVWAPGRVEPQDHTERVTLADLAPTTARLIGFDEFRAADGVALPGIPSVTPPVPAAGRRHVRDRRRRVERAAPLARRLAEPASA